MTDLREIIAKAIWLTKPDSGGMGKPWPFDGKTPKERRTIMHDMPAALELCFIYADAALLAQRREHEPSKLGVEGSNPSERAIDEVAIWKANHAAVVETKRRTTVRLQIALAALQKIYDDSCEDNIALIASEAFEEATREWSRSAETQG